MAKLPLEQQIIPAKDGFLSHPVFALLISIYFPGIGHMLFGQVKKGLVIFIFKLLWVLLTIALYCIGVGFIFYFFGIFFTIFYAIDAFFMAKKARDEGQIYEGECWHSISTFPTKFILSNINVFVSGTSEDPYATI